MNPKIEKLKAEREKLARRAAALVARVEDLDAQITELENTDILSLVRESHLTPDMLAALLRKARDGEESA